MKCNKCGSRKLRVIASGPHNKLVCTECLAFVKFLSKAEYKNWLALRGEKEEDHS